MALANVCAAVLPLFLVAAQGPDAAQQTCAVGANGPQLYGYELVAEYPHDARAFTQGLQHDTDCSKGAGACTDVFWESTGQYGESTVRQTNAATGAVIKRHNMGSRHFGEGLARFKDRLYQITWLTNQGFIYSIPDLQQVGTFATPLRDGWGITTAGSQMVLSDGSSTLTFVDPAQNFKAVRSVVVKDGERRVGYLNELEFINGEIWANVWQTECIARICPSSGQVTGWLLMHGLRDSLEARGLANQQMDVLNGIAYDAAKQRLFVTGKYWPRVFEVKPKPVANNAANQRLRNSCFVRG